MVSEVTMSEYLDAYHRESDWYWRIQNRYHHGLHQKDLAQVFRDRFKRDLPESVRTNDEYNLQLRRADSGFPCYWLWEKADLKHHVHNRGLQDIEAESPIQRDVTSLDLRQLGAVIRLEYADTRPKLDFDKFMELPPELRFTIYEYYLGDFRDRPLHAPTMPPLARVHKTLRAELIPIFFANTTFDVRLLQTTGLRHTGFVAWTDNHGPDGSKLVICARTAQSFSSIPSEYAKTIRRFRVSVHMYEYDGSPRWNHTLDHYSRSYADVAACAWWDVTIPAGDAGAVSVVPRKPDLVHPASVTFNGVLQQGVATKELEQAVQATIDPASGQCRVFGLDEVCSLRNAVDKGHPAFGRQ